MSVLTVPMPCMLTPLVTGHGAWAWLHVVRSGQAGPQVEPHIVEAQGRPLWCTQIRLSNGRKASGVRRQAVSHLASSTFIISA